MLGFQLNAPITRRMVAIFFIVTCLLSLTFIEGHSESLGNLQVSFLNVGQGDSALLQDPSGFDVLIDGGLASAGQRVVDELRARGVDDVDVLVATHADADHIGGLIDVLQMNDIPVLAVVYNGYLGSTQTWLNFIDAVSAEGLVPTVAQFPRVFNWGAMTVHVLNPPGGLTNPETNDASLVLRIDYNQFNLLFTGDIDTAVEAAVIARGTPLAAEILKVAHHGSSYGSGDNFLAAADPLDSIISVGNNNDYGHPAADTLQRLTGSGSKVWRTDQNGSLRIVSDGQAYTLSAEFNDLTFYLPMIASSGSGAVPVTPTPATPTPATPTPVTPTPETPAPSGQVEILTVFYDGVQGRAEPDEYVAFKNPGSQPVQLQGWTLRDQQSHVFTFPNFEMQPGQVCRVYTNEIHPEWCGFSYGSGSAIWNNTGDCALIQDAAGALKSQLCY